jgi:hypothetical protein
VSQEVGIGQHAHLGQVEPDELVLLRWPDAALGERILTLKKP